MCIKFVFVLQAKPESHHRVGKQVAKANHSRALPRPVFSSLLVVCTVS
jgi:hypothetical protein